MPLPPPRSTACSTRATEIPPEAIDGKLIVLNLLARDQAGRRFNIEMQVRRQPALSRRSVFYLARVMAGQLEAGKDYAALAPVIGIHLLGFKLFEAWPDQASWTFELRDRRRPAVALPDSPLQLNLVELPRADRLGQNWRDPLSAWVKFFEHAQESDIMSQIDCRADLLIRQLGVRFGAAPAPGELNRPAISAMIPEKPRQARGHGDAAPALPRACRF
ncbi:MAG: PD-(D/E)XK nuclease family transposase [Lautropia sp.]